jgi:threonine/homoserine/homoserine lactone efflux protein
MGLVVSMAPGVNGALCVGLARSGLRRARPVILAAAVTDCTYCLLSSLGLLAGARIDSGALRWLSVAFLGIAALLVWPRSPRQPQTRARLALVAGNPSTLAIWLGIAAVHPSVDAANPSVALALALGAALASGAWFMGLAYVSHQLGARLRWLSDRRLGSTLSFALGALAFVRAVLLCA